LGADLPLPVLIVQHMPAGFTRAFAERLNARLPLLVKEAIDGEPLAPSTVYIAPGGFHLRLALTESRLLTALAVEPGDRLHRPSVDVLFASAAEAGVRAVAVLLTGMGKDGCEGITQLSRRGALTIAQDEATSVVFGMPRAAAATGAVGEVLPLPQIGARLRR